MFWVGAIESLFFVYNKELRLRTNALILQRHILGSFYTLLKALNKNMV